MLMHGLKRPVILVARALLVALSLLSTASHGQGEKDGTPLPTPANTRTGINLPSVEQTLVPESVFAMQLAGALQLGPVTGEAKAEELLSSLGIEPKNGWIAEYPVTPEVLGDVEHGIAVASDQKKITLSKDQALKVFVDVKASLGFDVKPGPSPPAGLIKETGTTTIYNYTDNKGETHFTDDLDSIPKANRTNMKIISQAALNKALGSIGGGSPQAPGPQYTAKPSPEAINQQCEEQGGLPVVTYYAPPIPYSYLYSWFPYPFWSTGFYYPGYFVLKDFHRHVVVNRHPYFVTHHHGGGSDFSRSLNTGPVNRGLQGQLVPGRMNYFRGFSTPSAQSGARAIVEHNSNRNGFTNGIAGSRMDTSRRPFSSSGNSGTFGNTPVVPNGRIVMPNDMFRPGFQGGRSFEGSEGGGNFRGHEGNGFSAGVSRGGGHR